MVEKVTVFRTEDGEDFDNEDMAIRHETIFKLTNRMINAFDNFTDFEVPMRDVTRTACVQFLQGSREQIKEFLNLSDKTSVVTTCDYDFYRFIGLIRDLIDPDGSKIKDIPYDLELEMFQKIYAKFSYSGMAESDNPYDYTNSWVIKHKESIEGAILATAK